jgi:hypothetical protein
MALTPEELAAESGTALPAKEVMSLLDLNADVDLALDLAAPVDLAVAANLNVAAPIDAAVGANVLSFGSEATALAPQETLVDQHLAGEANATSNQAADLTQGATTGDDAPTSTPDAGTSSIGDITTGGNLLDINVDVDADANLAAPIAGAVAANANIAAPIDASVAANVASIDSHATSLAQQTAIVHQDLDGVQANADATQDSSISQ